MSIVCAVLNSKGGSGKSTLTTNLARALQLAGKRVLIADSDPQGTARDWRRVQEEDTVLPAVVGIDRPTMEKDIPQVAHAFDVILIDGAAKLQDMATSAIKAADAVLIPVQPSAADIWAAADLIELIQMRQNITDGTPICAFVVSRQIAGTVVAAEVEEALSTYGFPVFQSRTSQRVAYVEALAGGQTVLDTEPKGKAAIEINAIADEWMRWIDGK